MRNKQAQDLSYLEEYESYKSLKTTLVNSNFFSPQKQENSEITPGHCVRVEMLDTLKKYILSQFEKKECYFLH